MTKKIEKKENTDAKKQKKSTKKSREQELTITEVYDRLTKMAKTSGTGSVEKKINYLIELLTYCTPKEAKQSFYFKHAKNKISMLERMTKMKSFLLRIPYTSIHN